MPRSRNRRTPERRARYRERRRIDYGAKMAREVGTSPGPSMDLDVAGWPGQRQDLFLVPEYKDRPTPAFTGRPGRYKIVVALRRPGRALRDELSASSAQQLEGDSHLAITAPALQFPDGVAGPVSIGVRLDHKPGEPGTAVAGYPNQRGFLGRLELEVEASHFVHADELGHEYVARVLSLFAFQFHLPFDIEAMTIIEEATGAQHLSFRTPFPELAMWQLRIPPMLEGQFIALTSLYREALNNMGTPYAFLCLFRLIEAIYKQRRLAAEESRREGRQPPSYPGERLPSSLEELRSWLREHYWTGRDLDNRQLTSILVPEVLGKSFADVRESELEPLRYEIAHGLSDDGEILGPADQLRYLRRVEYWTPIATTMSRVLIVSTFPGCRPTQGDQTPGRDADDRRGGIKS